MSHQGSQPSGSVVNLDFTPDDLNHYLCLLLINLLVVFLIHSFLLYHFVQWLELAYVSGIFLKFHNLKSFILESKRISGVDGIPVRSIKAEPTSIGKIITRLVNSNITSGNFPDLWKLAVVKKR